MWPDFVSLPLHPGLPELGLRLILTLAAGMLIGINRGEHGNAAGMRTTTLVCLAAAVSMIQMNLLLPVAGKTSGSFAVMDIMRLPLGILSGIGFIGAGAILRKGDVVRGVTTAATLWTVTVIGLCLGGGQLALGMAATVLTWLVLYVLKIVDQRMSREHTAQLAIHRALDADIDEAMSAILAAAGRSSDFGSGCFDTTTGQAVATYIIRWHAHPGAGEPSALIARLLGLPGVSRIEWTGIT